MKLTNHPKVNTKGKATIVLASLVLASTLSACAAKKEDKDMDLTDNHDINNEYTILLELPTFKELFNDIKNRYHISDENGITFEGLVIKYFEEKLENKDAENIDQELKTILNNPNIYTDIYNYVMTNTPFTIAEIDYQADQNMNNNLWTIKNNEELMEKIERYASIYHVSLEEIIALMANSLIKGEIETINPMLINEEWYSINSQYTVHNYETKEDEDLEKLTKTAKSGLNNALKYNIMVCQSAIKQATGNGIDALKYLYFGPTKKSLNENEEKRLEQIKNDIFNYLLLEQNKRTTSLVTERYSDINKDATSKIIRIQTKDYTSDVINQVITDLNIILNADYIKAK